MPTRRLRARLALLATILVASMLIVGPSVATATTKLPPGGPTVRAQKIERVIRIAERQIGDPWVWGMRGPKAFDCTGLVYYSFKRAHALGLIGGHWRGVEALWTWARTRHEADRKDPKRGDLIVWGNAKHVGIYLGHGKAISALVSGVRIHKVHQLTDPLTTYLHLRAS